MTASLAVRASQMSHEDRAAIAYQLWKENGFSHNEVLPMGASRCSSEPDLFQRRCSDIDLEKSWPKAKKARFRKELRAAREEAKTICDTCPLVHACLAAAITIPAEDDKGRTIPGRVTFESDLVYGASTPEDRDKILTHLAEIWTDEWKNGKVKIPGLPNPVDEDEDAEA